MTASCFDHVNTMAHKNAESTGRQGSTSLIISRWESSPAGIDWEMIRSMKKTVGRKRARAKHSCTGGKNDT